MSTDLDPLAAWQHEIDELSFTVNLPLLAEPTAIRAICARIARYMDHFARYRRAVQRVSGFSETDSHQQLREAIEAMGRELQYATPVPTELSMRLNTLSSLVRVELQREHDFVDMLASHLDAPLINALSDLLAEEDLARDQGSASDGDDSWAKSPTQVDPDVDRSVDAVIERSVKDE